MNILEKNPASTLEQPKVPQRLPKVVSIKEIEEILLADLTELQLVMVEFLYSCGLRVSELVNLKISDIEANKQVRTMGIIKKIKEIETKQKEKMAFVELGDDTSNVEVVFFPKMYQESKPLKNGMILMVGGSTQKRTTLQVVADYIKKI